MKAPSHTPVFARLRRWTSGISKRRPSRQALSITDLESVTTEGPAASFEAIDTLRGSEWMRSLACETPNEADAEYARNYFDRHIERYGLQSPE